MLTKRRNEAEKVHWAMLFQQMTRDFENDNAVKTVSFCECVHPYPCLNAFYISLAPFFQVIDDVGPSLTKRWICAWHVSGVMSHDLTSKHGREIQVCELWWCTQMEAVHCARLTWKHGSLLHCKEIEIEKLLKQNEQCQSLGWPHEEVVSSKSLRQRARKFALTVGGLFSFWEPAFCQQPILQFQLYYDAGCAKTVNSKHSLPRPATHTQTEKLVPVPLTEPFECCHLLRNQTVSSKLFLGVFFLCFFGRILHQKKRTIPSSTAKLGTYEQPPRIKRPLCWRRQKHLKVNLLSLGTTCESMLWNYWSLQSKLVKANQKLIRWCSPAEVQKSINDVRNLADPQGIHRVKVVFPGFA